MRKWGWEYSTVMVRRAEALLLAPWGKIATLSLDRYFVRWRAWWFNKVPLSITLVLLLADGRPLRPAAMLALTLVVLAVCAVGNYGYALNDLYDIEEDARAGRFNAAAALGRPRTAWIVVVSALAAELVATAAAGWRGGAVTLLALGLPLVYSLPPWRIKESKWLGVAADALAAHVWPAVLAMLVVDHLGMRPIPPLLIAALLAWSLAAGIRGILSHQLHTADRDRQAGLTTVVHDFGPLPLERFITFVLLPIEAVGFATSVAVCDVGPPLLVLASVYLAYEAFKTLAGGFVVVAFRPQGQPYIPFVEESFYKRWGPLVLALDAARVDPAFLIVLPLYLILFRPHMRTAMNRLRAIAGALQKRAHTR